MIIPTDTPAISERYEVIGDIVTIVINDFRYFCSLCDNDSAIVKSDKTQWLMKPRSESAKTSCRLIARLGMVDQPDFAPSGADNKRSIWPKIESAHFQRTVLW
jgi:hypothetical protein